MPKKNPDIRKEAIDSFVSRADIYSAYESKPRTYGSDELLYAREVHAISAIGRHNGVDMGTLAKELGVTGGAATRTVNKLVRKGYVSRKQSSSDSRKYICRLTDKAKEIFAYHEALDSKTYRELSEKLSVFSDDEIKAAIRLLNIMAETIKEWK